MASSKTINRNRKVPAEDTAAFGAIAERFRRAGALDRAVGLCREGLQKFPDHISARATLGWALLDLGKHDEARAELEQVLRRAPDNLAAIRGLAELHDRFEHTLNLPMDGPGQWPPPPESVEASADLVAAETTRLDDAVSTFAAAGEADAEKNSVTELAEPEMPPAELGVPIWTPVTSAPPASSDSTGSGMSSLREIEVRPAASEFSTTADDEVIRAIDDALDRSERADIASPTPEPSAAVTGAATVEEAGVSDADIQALIAEAESLEAAAVSGLTTEPEPVGALALEATDDSDPLAAIAEVTGMAAAWVTPANSEVAEELAPVTLAQPYSSVTEPIAVEVDLSAAAPTLEGPEDAVAETPQLQAVETPSALIEVEQALPTPLVVESVESVPIGDAFVLTAPEESDFLSFQPDETEIVLEAGAFAIDPEIAPLLPFTSASSESTIEESTTDAPALAELALAEPSVPELAPIELAVPEPTVEDAPLEAAIIQIAAAEMAHVVGTAATVEAVAIDTGGRRSLLPRLERLLAQVHARRAQLMAESVA
jgi:tetratricopeptide (TPR) repeat protein